MVSAKEILESDPMYKEFVRRTSVPDFITETFPKTKGTPIPGIVNKVLVGLKPFCAPNEHEVLYIVRGGGMRMFEQDSQYFEQLLTGAVGQLPKASIGDDPLTREVLRNTFPSTKDLDIRFNPLTLIHEFTDGVFALRLTPGMIAINLKRTLRELGFEEIKANQFKKDKYTLFFAQSSYGVTKKQSNYHLDFYQEGSKEAVFRLDLGHTPATAEEERENLRIGDDVSDLDKRTNSFIFEEDGTLVVRYFSYHGFQEANLYLQEYYFNLETNPLEMGTDFVKTLSKGFRSIDFRLPNQAVLLTHYADLTLPKLVASFPHLKGYIIGPQMMDEWISRQKAAIEARRVALLSDITYGMVANPFLTVPLAFYTQFLAAIPLGRMIDNPAKLKAVVDSMAEKAGMRPEAPFFDLSLGYLAKCTSIHPEKIGPLLLIDALKAHDLVPKDAPRTLSFAVNELFNPLRLIAKPR